MTIVTRITISLFGCGLGLYVTNIVINEFMKVKEIVDMFPFIVDMFPFIFLCIIIMFAGNIYLSIGYESYLNDEEVNEPKGKQTYLEYVKERLAVERMLR